MRVLLIQRKIIKEKWFCKNVNLNDFFKLVAYNQCKIKHNFFIKRKEFNTIHIDLLQTKEEIFNNFSKNTKYEIKRAIKNGANFYILDITIQEYVKRYNLFAKTKNINLINNKEIKYYWNNLIIAGGGKSLYDLDVINSYIVDNNRARLFHSISIFRSDNSKNRNFVGMVNRFVHFEAMKLFKYKGYKIYDLGGISNKKELQGITKFKQGFSKNIVIEYHLVSPLLYLLLKLKGNI